MKPSIQDLVNYDTRLFVVPNCRVKANAASFGEIVLLFLEYTFSYHTSLIPVVRLFLTLNLTADYSIYLIQIKGSLQEWPVNKVMLAPLRHLIPPLVCLCQVVFLQHLWDWSKRQFYHQKKEALSSIFSIHRKPSSHTLSWYWSF